MSLPNTPVEHYGANLAEVRRQRSQMKRKGRVILLTIAFAALLLIVQQIIVSHVRMQEAITNVCRSNREVLEDWKLDWFLRTGAPVTPSPSDILRYGDGRGMPVCPVGGTYALGNRSESVRCTFHGSERSPRPLRWWEGTRTIEQPRPRDAVPASRDARKVGPQGGRT